MKNIVLIDGNALMYRSYHGVRNGFIPLFDGKPIGMVYGFASTILHIIDFFRPDGLFFTFDTKEKTFRHDMDDAYKAHREKAPDDFYDQIPYVFEFLEAFHVPVLTCPGYESDDIIATIALQSPKGSQVKIVSGDLDFLQLVSEKIVLVKLNGKVEQSVLYGPKETKARYGITPLQMIDLKALMGDSSDNYKGIEGIGPKTASQLLQQYGTIEGIYDHLTELKSSLQEKFRSHREYVFHCRDLARLRTDVPVEFSFDNAFDFISDDLSTFFQKMAFRSLEQRYQKLINKITHEVVGGSHKKGNDSCEVVQASLFE